MVTPHNSLQSIEEAKQIVNLRRAVQLDRRLVEALQYLSLHLDVRFDVLMRRLWTLVPQPSAPHTVR